jgi:hypothetical protein
MIMLKECKTKQCQGTLQHLYWKVKERPRKRWKDEVEDDLNIMGIKNNNVIDREVRNRGKIIGIHG